MSRQPLPIGTWGRIHTRVEKTDEKDKPVSIRAQAKYRDHEGVTRPVSAFGKTKTAAENNLLKNSASRPTTFESNPWTSTRGRGLVLIRTGRRGGGASCMVTFSRYDCRNRRLRHEGRVVTLRART
jgi:hypothetical protein